MSGSVALNVSPTIEVKVGEQVFSISRGTRVKAFLRRYLPDIAGDVLGAIVANQLTDLETPIASSCELTPVTFASKEGARIYRATLTVMLCEAVERVFPGSKVMVGQSFGDGYFFDVHLGRQLTADDVQAIEAEMKAMIHRKEALATFRVPKLQAVEVLSSLGSDTSARLVETLRWSWVPLVTMGKKVLLSFHPLLPTTEGIQQFRVELYRNGVLLILPPPSRSDEAPDPVRNHTTLYAAYMRAREFNEKVGISTVADLNQSIISGRIGEVIRIAEAAHERRVITIADAVAAKKDCRLVLLAGPSSSGKTSTVKRLRMQLMAIGLRPKVLSVDNYYVDRSKTPLDADGEYDFECIEAIDLPLLNEHLEMLLAGQEVQMPRYSFFKGVREEVTTPVQLEDGEILLMEGIHGLNDRLTESVPDHHKMRIYMSALTQLSIDHQNRIFTSDSRLIRRIVRDRMYRGYSAARTIHMWPKVRAGEEKWIFPFQEQADFMFNSTLVYEPAVLKMFAERFLMEVPVSDPAFVEASRLLEFLDLFVPVFGGDVPATSILREFIGGSAFEY